MRIPLHTLHAAKHGHASIFWRTADTDVVVLGVKTLAEKEGIIADIVIGFGTRTKKSGMRYYAQPVLSILRKITCYGSRPAYYLLLVLIFQCFCRYIVVSLIIDFIGWSKALALPGFHAFTGCDTTCSIIGYAKITAWKVWISYPAATEAFMELSTPHEDVQELLPILPKIETFVNKLFLGISNEYSSVDAARLDALIYKSKNFSNIPPSSDALFQKVLRTVMQVCYDT